jgi:hypothetical protein
MTATIQWGKTTLLLHDPVFQDGYEAGRNACLEHLHDESPRTAITDFTLQTLFVTAPIPSDCASPLSWQLGYYLGYVSSPILSEEGAVCNWLKSTSLTGMIPATA